MKKVFGFLVIVFFVYAGIVILRALPAKLATNVQAAAIAATNTQYATPTFRPTETPIPTSTIGYEATIYVAQATADEARRVNAQATAQHETYILSIVQITAAQDARSQEVLSWTAQAAPTIIPLTATAQVIYNTQVAIGEARVAAMMTMTHEAPAQYALMVEAQSNAQYASIKQIANIAGMGALIVFLLALTAYFVRVPPASQVQADSQIETVVQVRRDNGQGSFTQTRAIVPCSPEQLTELAEMAVNEGEKKFGINRLETGSRTFKGQRETLLAVRQFLIDGQFVITDGNGTITLNADGESFLAGWFDAHKLPNEYEFGEQEPPPLPHSMGMEIHGHDEKHDDFGGGGGQDTPEGEEEYTQEGAI